MIGAIIMAAGAGRRFGSIKQLQRLRQHTLVRSLAITLCGVNFFDRIIAVVGCQGEAVAAELTGLPVLVCHNPDWEQGQSTTIRRGLEHLSPACRAAMFFVADQPLLTASVITVLVENWHLNRDRIIVPFSEGNPANPVIFPWPQFSDQFHRLQGDEGARKIWRSNPDKVKFVEFDSRIAFTDVDRPEDWEMIKAWQTEHAD
ncbi:MAG: nucleotidyltransferase family protein [Negativicutes bacterium]|nr:nucleotidyltransferase family protein [Negativicutes bacterium]